MSKLWKRLIMLGALIGCMATAAWAGNVEVDLLSGVTTRYAAEGYYETARPLSQSEYHFDNAGRVVREKETVVSGSVYDTWYTYDQNGLLIRSFFVAQNSSDPSDNYSIINTYAYDKQGRIITHSYSSYWVVFYTYEEGKITAEEIYDGDLYKKTVYTLNRKNKIVEEAVYKKMGGDSEELFLYSDMKYSYDNNGNLVNVKTYIDDDMLSAELKFEYNEKEQCVSCERRTLNSTYDVDTYKYDENGNIVKEIRSSYNSKDEVISTKSTDYTYEKLSPVQDDPVYTDVTNKNAYFYDAVNWATQTGVAAGVGNNQFAPNGSCTRAQLVSFLWRAAGEPEPETTESPFTDVQNPKAYYYKAVLWAAENGIAAGVGNNRFAPNQTCTRAQIVSFIYRASGDKETYTENPFKDVSEKDYFYKAALWGVANGVVAGTSDTTFSPNQTCTRAQGVSFLYRGFGLY